MRARNVGTVCGRPVLSVPVEIRREAFRRTLHCETVVMRVLAHTLTEAADFARDLWKAMPNTEIMAYGPKGGTRARRFIGFASATSAAICEAQSARDQLQLPL